MKDSRQVEKIYQKKTQLEHIILRPDTYIGSIDIQKDKLWVFNSDSKLLEFREVNYVPGLFKIFDEILVNAADNYQRDNSMSHIKVNIDTANGRIRILNGGAGIPIEIHKEYDIYVPELIFGHLLTSSNYNDNDKKVTGGRNGYGAKLTNIFSKLFIVETADGKTGKYYKQVFKNNMSHKSQPEISSYNKEDFTCITFEPDLGKFKMEKLDRDIVALFKKRVYDMAGATPKSVKVYLDDEKLEIKNFSSYIDMYLKSSVDEEVEALPPKVFESPHERWEVCMSLSEGQFQQVSFVNAISTSKGGTHVNYVTDKIVEHVLEAVKKKSKNCNVKAHNVKQHLWVFVNCLIENASFDSQTKENMTLKSSLFGSSFDLSDKFLKDVLKTGIVDHCLKFAKVRDELKMNRELNSGIRKSGRIVGIDKLEDANNAGGKNSHNCTLILTEGDSAKALAMAGIEVVGRDAFGCFPLRGKLLNVRDAKALQIKGNEEIQNLMKILGIQMGKSYTDIKSLRYGSIMIMTDQDTDGSHIKGLIINFIQHFWPSLFKMNGFLKEFITPIIKATKGDRSKAFYTIPEYKNWVNSIGGSTKGWKIKYYKGLGTSTSKEAQEYFSNIIRHKIDFEYVDDNDDSAIDMAFNKKKTEDRKNWLTNFNPQDSLQDSNIDKMRYLDFINKELVLFSISDNQRSIPSICDGLKPSERKILYACFKRNLKEEIKVAQLTGYVSEHSAYHHGEQSLNSTIVAMAQNFVGSNNINLLMPIGQFGTRNQGGKDMASARYIFTNLNKVTRHLFNENDLPLMDYIIEEGQKIEPEWYLPIIPLILINGSEGIGTGWSSHVPCYNPRELVQNLMKKTQTGEFFEMKPWYKGYTGNIEKNDKGSYTVTGKFEWDDNEPNTLVITELPIKKWTKDYKNFLEELMGLEVAKESKEKGKKKKKKDEDEDEEEEKKDKKEKRTVILEDIRQAHSSNRVRFEVKVIQSVAEDLKNNPDKVIKKFKLQTTISTTNMVLFDHSGKIKKYNTVEDILDEFYSLRTQYYEKRKEYLLSNMKRDLLLLDNKVRFILAVISETLIIRKVKKADLIATLIKEGYTPMSKIDQMRQKASNEVEIINPEEVEDDHENMNERLPLPAKEYDYLLTMPLWSLTYEKVNELLKQKENKNKELELLSHTTVQDMWTNDMTNFLHALDEYEQLEEEERQVGDKIKKKTGGEGHKGKRKKAPKEEKEKPKAKKQGKEDQMIKIPEETNGERALKVKKDEETKRIESNPFVEASENVKKGMGDETIDRFKVPLKERLCKINIFKIDNERGVAQISQSVNLHDESRKRRIKSTVDDDEAINSLLYDQNIVKENKTSGGQLRFNVNSFSKKDKVIQDEDESDNSLFKF